MAFRTFRAAAGAAALLLASAASLHGQSFGGSVGLAAPIGSLADHRGVGFRMQASAYSSGGRLRADLSAMSLPGDGEGTAVSLVGDYRTISFAVNGLPRLLYTESVSVRVLAGLSGHRVSIPGVRNPYGIVPGAQLGTVVERRTGRGWMMAEAGVHLVASDFGVGELEGALFVPVTVGFRW